MLQDARFVPMGTAYARYSGALARHCPILDHENKGMLQNVRIDLR